MTSSSVPVDNIAKAPDGKGSNSGSIQYAILGCMFFLSGFCGLLYQTVWLRLAFGHFGVISPVISVVISAFMIGLASGSWIAGKYIVHLTKKTKLPAIAFYGLIEVTIGIGALVVPILFKTFAHAFLTMDNASSWEYLLATGVGISLSILPWTIAMGMTYPVVLEFINELKIKTTRGFSFLYTANTMGAILGSFIPVFILIECLGFTRTLTVAAITNFLVAACAIAWAFKIKSSSSIDSKSASDQTYSLPDDQKSKEQGNSTEVFPSPLFPQIVLFTTGFCSMGMEVVWVRLLSPLMPQSVYTFAYMLMCYLAGNAIGSATYTRTKNEKHVFSITMLLALTACTGCFPLLAASQNFLTVSASENWLRSLMSIPMSLLLISAALGYLTPRIIDLMSKNDVAKVGKAYAINIIGCVIGPLIAGYCLLPNLGGRMSLILLLLPVLGLVYWARGSVPLKAGTTLIVAAIIALSHGQTYEDGILTNDNLPREIFRDYAATTVAMTYQKTKRLFVNGNGMTTLSPITKVMVHLPFVAHITPPKKVLVICFGMGTTFKSVLSWNDCDVTAVELIPSVPKAFNYFHKDAEELLHRPNAHVVIDDGRRFLSRTNEKYDVILIDPPPPASQPGSSLLYSKEFYTLLKKHLAEGGILQQWWGFEKNVTCSAFVRSLVDVFPCVRAFKAIKDPDGMMDGFHFLCTDKPVGDISLANFLERMPPSAQLDLQEWSKAKNPNEEMKGRLSQLLANEVKVKDFLRDDPTVVITDDHPFNEYALYRIYEGKESSYRP
jgi:spermidine synthase